MFCVTGATGLVGSHVVMELVNQGLPVLACYHSRLPDSLHAVFSQRNLSVHDPLIQWRKLDVLEDFYAEGPQLTGLFHCAAMVSFHPKDVERMFEVNVQGTASVVNWALENEVPVCHVSSIAAIGSPMQDGIADEQCIWHDDKTHTQYSRSKFYSEMEVWRAMEEGLNAVIVNPGVVIGCGDGQSSSGLLFKTISRNLKLYPMGSAGYIGAVDLARGMVALMLQKKWGERFIVVSDNLTMKEVFGMIAESLGLAKPHIPTRPFVLNAVRLFEWIKEVFTGTPSVVTTDTVKNTGKHRKFSSEKWKKTLGWEFEPIAKVIHEAGEFYKNNNVNKK